MIKRLILFIAILSNSCLAAELSLPAVFSDHMVLQRELSVPVWGKADPGATITIQFADQTKTVVAATNGKWRANLAPMPASSESRELIVSSSIGNQKSTFNDVLVGEVWLCSGQSNMQMPMEGWSNSPCENAEASIAAANYPQIRLFNTPLVPSATPLETVKAEWNICTSETVKSFSATAYYFGRKLHQDLNVPVGLLLSAWGGTRIEPWTPPRGFKNVASLQDIYQRTQNALQLNEKGPQQTPTALYNGMIAAHIPFAIRGAIWYQGEANRTDGMLYVDKTRALVNGWRALWGYNFPFYFVQIAPFHYKNEEPSVLPTFWEAQAAIEKNIPNTGMAVVSDYATTNNIHPPNKEIPGTRLALLAEARNYNKKNVCSGPTFKALEKTPGGLKVTFDSAEGLTTRDGKSPDWFEIAGADGVFKPAQAVIKDNGIIIRSPEVAEPVAMRFAWHKLAMPNLANGTGLPASAFRATVK
ncbi:MAG: sialate O-acetylesterase [Kiritimatiellaceae bacterium]|nr:sialate O-acetylesterase [Kiritimatiellaceae bacterium]